MVRIPLDLLQDVAHAGQYGWLGILVNVALKKLEDVEAIARILHKCRKQNVQAVVHGDEVVPVARATPQRGLISLERFAAEVSSLERADDVLVRESRAVQCDADASGEDGIDETSRIANQNQAITGELLHRVAVVAFILEGMHLHRALRLEAFVEFRAALDALPEEFLARFLALGEILFLRDHADAGHGLADGNLPDPGVGDGKEVNKNEIALSLLVGGHAAAVVAVEPGGERGLVEVIVLDAPFYLISDQRFAARGGDHDAAGRG